MKCCGLASHKPKSAAKLITMESGEAKGAAGEGGGAAH